MSGKVDAVFFISFGGPEKREDVRPFLEIVTRGLPIPPERLDEVVHHYEALGGASPINKITQAQAAGLVQTLLRTDTPWPVYVGNRNWHPFIEDALRKMAADGVHRAVGFITAAHRSPASQPRYIKAVEAAREKIGPGTPEIDYVEPWFDHPLFIQALVARAEDALQDVPESDRATIPLVFTAHSIPTCLSDQSPYIADLEKTADAVATRLGRSEWKLAYTSRSGNPSDPWLEPDISDLIRQLAERKEKRLLVVPIGFIADHVEVLFDLDIEAKQTAEKLGMTLHRAKTVGTHPLFIQMIADVVRKTAHSPSVTK
jgi:ferrochelatase